MTTVPFPDFPRLALVDWDGTFCDSRESIYEINRAMATHYQKELPSYEDWLQASHPGVEACMKSIGVTENRQSINEFFNRLLVNQREAGLQNPLYPGAHELLRFLEYRNIPIVVISRHLHEHLVNDIEAHGLQSYFYDIIGEPAESSLQKDVVMDWVCTEFDVPCQHAFYLGDTSHDMRLARQAGVCAVAVSHGYDPPAELTKQSPAYIFESLTEFQKFLSG